MEGRSVEISLCGEPQVRFEGELWPFRVPATCWALLDLLATNRNAIARESLAATLWPDCERVESLTNLRRHVHMIARGLPPAAEPWIAGTKKTVAWNHDGPARVDVMEFERALAAGNDREAVEIYRGDLLPLSFEDFIVARRERLRGAYLGALERLIAEARASREFSKALEYAERLLATDEWREDAAREWMSAKYESGDASSALAMYERLARRLADEFSADPARETSALRDLIVAGSPLPKSAEAPMERHADDALERRSIHPFVGRAEPLEQLGAMWSRAVRGSGGVAFISGEPGIGKSRLARELATPVRDRGGRMLFGTTSDPENEPYEAVIAALRFALDPSVAGIGDQWLGTLARVIPEIHGLRDGLTQPAVSMDGSRERLFDAILRLVEHLAKKRPLCFVLEDLHRAGPGTIDLIATLARRVGTLPVAAIVTYRSDASTTSGIAELAERLVDERRATACRLDRLDDREVAAIVDASLGDAGAALRESVARSSEGNPLFVAQLVANYLETGSSPDLDAVPGSVGDAISARFRRLDPKTRAIAETAAVIGELFRADVLAAAGGWDENAVLDALESLTERAIVRESAGPLEYVFAHWLFAATLYGESSPEQRTARHRRIATVLERDPNDDAASAASLARHWKAVGENARAAQLYLRAAEAALRFYATDEAIAFAREALLLTLDRNERFAAGLLISQAQNTNGDADDWEKDLDALDGLASSLGAAEHFDAMAERESYYNRVGDRGKQRAAIDAMLELTQGAWSPERRVAALSALGRLYIVQSELLEALEPLHEALEIVSEEPLGDDVFALRERLSHAYARLGRHAEASAEIAAMHDALRRGSSNARETFVLRAELAVAISRQATGQGRPAAERLLSIARETGDYESELAARLSLAWSLQFEADVATVRSHYDRAYQIAERLGFAKAIASLLMDRGSYEWRIGNARGAIAFYDRAIEFLQGDTSRTMLGLCLANRASILSIDGAPSEALAGALEACAVAAEEGDLRLKAAAGAAYAAATVAGGDPEQGFALMQEPLGIRRAMNDAFGLANDLCVQITALLDLKRSDEAAPLLDELGSLYAADPRCEYPVRTCYLLGTAARRRGDERQARVYLNRGAQLLARELERAPDEEARQTIAARLFHRAILHGK